MMYYTRDKSLWGRSRGRSVALSIILLAVPLRCCTYDISRVLDVFFALFFVVIYSNTHILLLRIRTCGAFLLEIHAGLANVVFFRFLPLQSSASVSYFARVASAFNNHS
jgi:hypothetical protein